MIPQHFVRSSDGKLIAVRERGPKDGKPVLLIHGLFLNSAVWHHQFSSPALQDFRLVAMDLRGHGFSEKPVSDSAYTTDLLADDVHAVVQALHLYKPAIVAWSNGGIVLLEYLRKYGDCDLAGISLVNSTACPDSDCAKALTERAGQFPAMVDLLSADAAVSFRGVQGFTEAVSGGALSTEEKLIFETLMLAAPQFARVGFLSIPNVAYGEVIAAIQVPVILQLGSPDPISTPETMAKIQKLVELSTTKQYPGAAHLPFTLAAERFNADLAEWLHTLKQ